MPVAISVKLTMNSIVSAARDQVSSDLAGEVVILNLAAGVYHGLQEVGARAWQLIQSPRAVSQIRQGLMAEYEVEADRCERDLLEFLEDLAAHGLLEVHARRPA